MSDCSLGLMTKKQKVPHKNVINFAILLFFSLLLQEYYNNTMNILRRWCRIATFLMAFLSNN